jgi:hypothetical protein
MQLDQHFPADKTDMFLASKLMPLTIATMTPAEIARVFGWYSAAYPKMQRFNRKSTAGVRSVKILSISHPPYLMLSFWPTQIITQTFAKSSTFY